MSHQDQSQRIHPFFKRQKVHSSALASSSSSSAVSNSSNPSSPALLVNQNVSDHQEAALEHAPSSPQLQECVNQPYCDAIELDVDEKVASSSTPCTSSSQSSSASASSHGSYRGLGGGYKLLSDAECGNVLVLRKLDYSSRSWKPYRADWSAIKEYEAPDSDKSSKSSKSLVVPDGNVSIAESELKILRLRVHDTVHGKNADRSKEGMSYIVLQQDNAPRLIVYCAICHEMKGHIEKPSLWSVGIWISSKVGVHNT